MTFLYESFECADFGDPDGNALFPGRLFVAGLKQLQAGDSICIKLISGKVVEARVVKDTFVELDATAAEQCRAKSEGMHSVIFINKDIVLPGIELGAGVYLKD